MSNDGAHRSTVLAGEGLSTNAARGELFRDVVAALDEAGIGLCVLRGYEGIPEAISPDVDAVSDDPEGIPRVLLERGVATVAQVFEHETTSYYLYRWAGGRPVFITLDVSGDYRYRGRKLLEGKEILATSRPYKFFRVPSPELEFVSYLLRKVAQGEIGEGQARRLSGLYAENPEGAERQIARFFPDDEEASAIGEAARSGEWGPVRDRIKALRRAMWAAVDRGLPLSAARYRAGVLRWRAKRILRPPGLMVAFLGTDGSGKSTVMARVERDLSPAFWGGRQYHKRPLSSPFRWTKRYRFGPPRNGSGEAKESASEESASGFNPHGIPSRGPVYSLAKLAFWWADYVFLGYLADVLPRLTRFTLILFDRYYQDLLVDPRRYHYGGSMRLARLVGRLIPQPHLVMVLDAPPEVLHRRKQELPIEETTRQREAYLRLARDLPNGYVVDTSRPLDEAVADAERIVLDHMSERVTRRMGSLPAQADGASRNGRIEGPR